MEYNEAIGFYSNFMCILWGTWKARNRVVFFRRNVQTQFVHQNKSGGCYTILTPPNVTSSGNEERTRRLKLTSQSRGSEASYWKAVFCFVEGQGGNNVGMETQGESQIVNNCL